MNQRLGEYVDGADYVRWHNWHFIAVFICTGEFHVRRIDELGETCEKYRYRKIPGRQTNRDIKRFVDALIDKGVFE